MMDRDTHELLYAAISDGIPKRVWLNKSAFMSKKMRALEKAFPNHYVSLASSTENREELILYVWSDTDPGGYYSFKTKTNELTDLGLNPRKWIDPSKMSPMEPISYLARDGMKISGYLTRPKNQQNNLPLIVLVHGGPHGVRDDWGFDGEIQLLANRGFAVLQVNYRGSGGYGREFLKSGFNHWGDLMQDDLTDGVNFLVDQGIVDKDRLCIYGASYGGYAAMMSAAREPDLYKCAVGYVGVYDVDSFTTVGNIPGYRAGSAYLKEVIPSDPDLRNAFSPSKQAAKIKAEVFLVHGEKDEQAHFENYEILTKKFDDLNKPYKSLVKFDEEHGFYKTENQIELAFDLEEFFTKHIGSSN
jgi:dipeptidyl aminopeptidase/acylaminoacyl peptidase